MKRIARYSIFLIIGIAAIWVTKNWWEDSMEKDRLTAETALIQKQINHTSKLVVTELSYAKVYTYENTRDMGWSFFDVKKKALVISEPKVQISYDLRELAYDLLEETKTIRITKIPEPEINIDPNLNYYSIEDYALNRFKARDFNKIRKEIIREIEKEVRNDAEINNSQNRLLSELSNIYVLSNSLGWKLVYNGNEINSTKELNKVLF